MNHSFTLQVQTSHESYPVVIGAGALAELPERLHALGLRGALWLITNTTLAPKFGGVIEAAARAAGYTIHTHTVPDGEYTKELSFVSGIYDWMITGGIERRDVVLALGGGVIGDLAGFAAATILRGVAFVQLPTTLLAMVDSSIGGKTGVNHALGKNLIGAFHPPRLVISDTTLLHSLPPREQRSGMAEVIKHAVIRDAGMFDLLATMQNRGSDMLTPELIARAARVKVDIVNADEHEHGDRMLLNYGHTLGHALEAATGFNTFTHGEAVTIGMHLEGQIAAALGMVDAHFVECQRALIQSYGLPTDLPARVPTDQLLRLTLRDKKVQAGKVRWALPTGIGSATTRNDVPEALVRMAINSSREQHGGNHLH